MAQQDEGWPLGLQPLNVRNHGSISFNTLITASPSSSSHSHSSSDLDTESTTTSFFHDKSITLGSLIGITSILEFSRRSTRRRTIVETKIRDNNNNKNKKKKSININSNKSRTWLFSLCSKLTTDAVNINSINSAPSLGHFLEEERKAAANNNINYGLDDFNQLLDHDHSNLNNNSLFISGQIAPPHDNDDESKKGLFEQNDQNGNHGSPLIFSCLCGHLVH
ncbi:uncharacterized protein At3g17950 [Solanum lycopersicum]|uniref:Uncharacterized protein n=1 Tax=Solanum lycopersicum TaxID=4081 RepID=A0A3Q7HY72_SOLLC|nr:uncharacterized protein At3g17950 isoform X1 [Solanum lycopersicum]